MYQSSELQLFQYAVGWKKYFSEYLKPYIKGSALEVGAGIGETTRYLYTNHQYWLSLNPVYNLAQAIKDKVKERLLSNSLSVMDGTIINLFYCDSIGLGSSLFNKFFLKQSTPSKNQVLFWDQYLIPLSKIMDNLTFRSFGKSLIGVWQKQ